MLAIVVYAALTAGGLRGALVCSDAMPAWQAREITPYTRLARPDPSRPYLVVEGAPDWNLTVRACGAPDAR